MLPQVGIEYGALIISDSKSNTLNQRLIRDPGYIPTRGNIFKFYNPNLHNIARSDRIGFKTKNPNENVYGPVRTVCTFVRVLKQQKLLEKLINLPLTDGTQWWTQWSFYTLRGANFLQFHRVSQKM